MWHEHDMTCLVFISDKLLTNCFVIHWNAFGEREMHYGKYLFFSCLILQKSFLRWTLNSGWWPKWLKLRLRTRYSDKNNMTYVALPQAIQYTALSCYTPHKIHIKNIYILKIAKINFHWIITCYWKCTAYLNHACCNYTHAYTAQNQYCSNWCTGKKVMLLSATKIPGQTIDICRSMVNRHCIYTRISHFRSKMYLSGEKSNYSTGTTG